MANDIMNIVIPEQYSYGATFAPRFKSNIVIVNSGKEQRNADWQTALWEISINYTTQRKEQIQDIENLYLQSLGPIRSFLFNNKKDNEVSTVNGIANEDGILKGKPFFSLYKWYAFDLAYDKYYRRIFRPQPGTVKIYNNGVLQTWDVDYDTGAVELPLISQKEILGITKATNAIVTATAHGFTTGNKIFLSNITGMTELNNRVFTITYLTVDTFALNVNTLAFNPFTYVSANKTYAKKYINGTENITWEGKFYNVVRFKEDSLATSYDTFNSFSAQCILTEFRLDEENTTTLDE